MPGQTFRYGLFRNASLAESRRILPRNADQWEIDAVGFLGGRGSTLAARKDPARSSTGALLLTGTTLVTAVAGFLAVPQASHAQAIWQANNSTDYNAGANWSTGAVPDAAGTVAQFTNVGSPTVTVNGPVAPTAWEFDGPGNFAISGTDVNFQPVDGLGGIIVDAGAQQINNNISETGGAASIEVNSGATLTLAGTNTYTGPTTIDSEASLLLNGSGSVSKSSGVSDNGSFDISGTTAGTSITSLSGSGVVGLGSRTLTLTNASGTFSGQVADGGASGGTGGGLTLAAGTWTLTSANTYTGTTTISNGAGLLLSGSGSIAKSSGVFGVFDAGTFDISGTTAGTSITSLSGPDSGAVFLGGKTLTLTNASGRFAGVISDGGGSGGTGGGLTIAGGTETLDGTNTYTGPTNVNAGTLVVDGSILNTSRVTVNPAATLQLGDGVGSGSVGGNIVDNGVVVVNLGVGGGVAASPISGTGRVTLQSGQFSTSFVNTYSGVTTIDSGAILGLVNAGSISNSSAVVDNGTFDIAGTTAGASIRALSGSGTVNLGAMTLTLTNAGGTFSGVITTDGTGGGLTIAGGTETLTGTSTGAITIDNGGDLILNGSGSVAKSPGVTNNGAFDISGTTAGTSITSLSGSGIVGLGSRTLTLTNASGTFSGQVGVGGASGGAGGGLTIAGGTETLTGTNPYSGATMIDSGARLLLSGSGSIPNSSDVVDNGTFDISGTSGTATGVTSIRSLSGSGTVTIGGESLILTNASGTFSGTIADGGRFGDLFGDVTVAGGTETVTGMSMLRGAPTINPGATLQWGDGTGVGFLVGKEVMGVIDNGVLDINFGSAGVGGASLPISGTGSLTVQSGVFIAAVANTYTGATTINGGARLILGDPDSISLSSNVSDNGTVDISATPAGASITSLSGPGTVILGGKVLTLTNAAGIFSGAITDGGPGVGTGGGLTIGGGTETLTGTNSYTGATTINAGATLQLGNGGATGLVAGNIIDSGLVRFNHSGLETVGSTFTGPGNVEIAAGTVVVTGASGLGGTVTIDPGTTMQWGAGNPGFLVGNAGVVDNGALVINFGDGRVGASSPISGTGGVTLQSGSFNNAGVSTYTGATTISRGASLLLSNAGSISSSSSVSDNGAFDISGTTAGTSIRSISGAGSVNLGGKTLTLTGALAIFSGVIADGGVSGGMGGGLTIAGGTELLTGANTYTGATTIDSGAGLLLSGSISNTSGVFDAGNFDISATTAGASINSISGTGTVFLGGRTLTLSNASGTFAGTISGSGGLTLEAGMETLTGSNLYSGATTLNGGTLVVDGSIASASSVEVNSGATLAGVGIVDPATTTIMSGGTLAPGDAANPTGKLTVTGNLALQSGAIYRVQVNSSSASLANITGSATLGGALVNAAFANGGLVSKQYPILTAAGGVSGTFAPLVVNTNLPSDFSTALSYDANHAFLDLSLDFTRGGRLTGDELAVGNALIHSFNTSGGVPTVYGTLTPAGLTQAADEIETAPEETTFDAMGQFMDHLTEHPFVNLTGGAGVAPGASVALAYAENTYAATETDGSAMFSRVLPEAPGTPLRWSVWATGFGGSQSTSGNAAVGSTDTTSHIFGTEVGADYLVSPNTIAGFALAGGGTNFSVSGSGSGHSDLFQVGAYVRHNIGDAYITVALAYGWQDITTDRFVTIAGFDHLHSAFNANAWSGRLEGGYRFVAPWVGGITPYAGGQFTTLGLPAYSESAVSGSDAFGLAFRAQRVTDGRSEFGIRTDKSFAIGNATLTLRGRLAWAHDFNPDSALAATFEALPGTSFVVNGAAQARDAALTTASVEMDWRNGWSVAATFEGEFSGVTRSYAAMGLVRYSW